MIKKQKINYLAKSFPDIKAELNNYAKRYYPNIFADLSEASINSFFIETTAYVGDILSYYIDFQANESFLSTAIESRNILNLAKSLGYKESPSKATTGKVTLYLLVPSDGNNNPDYTRAPTIKRGTVFSTSDGTEFSLTEDITLSVNTVGSSYVVARTNNIGSPTFYAVKLDVPVISGKLFTENYSVGNFIKFRKLFLNKINVTEIVSVVDSDENEYVEVPNLTQNIVYKSYQNSDYSTNDTVKSILKPTIAQRRFVFDYENGSPFLLFGAKEYDANADLSINPVAEPNKFILEKYNNDFLSEALFEPNQLTNGDNFGVGPNNTVLTITYRSSNSTNNNFSAGEINTVKNLLYEFRSGVVVDSDTISTILSSVQVINEEAILGETVSVSANEIKSIGGLIFQSQGRAVTARDYEALIYLMPAKFGSIKRVKAEKDPRSLKNNINVYVACSNQFDQLALANTKIKENIKFWLSQYKLATDSVDILDAKIINLGIQYSILVDPNFDKLDVKRRVDQQLAFAFNFKPQIGENFNILDIRREIQKINGILDIRDIKVTNKTSAGYSQTYLNIDENISDDGNFIMIPRNAIYEIKVPVSDILGKLL